MLTTCEFLFFNYRLQAGVGDRVKEGNDFSASLIKQIRSEKSHVIEVKLSCYVML